MDDKVSEFNEKFNIFNELICKQTNTLSLNIGKLEWNFCKKSDALDNRIKFITGILEDVRIKKTLDGLKETLSEDQRVSNSTEELKKQK